MILVTSKANIKDEQVFIMLRNELPSKLLASSGARSTFLSHPDNQDNSSFCNLFLTAWDISNSTETLCTSFGSSRPGTRCLCQSHPEMQAADPTGSRSYQDSSRVFNPGWLKAKKLTLLLKDRAWAFQVLHLFIPVFSNSWCWTNTAHGCGHCLHEGTRELGKDQSSSIGQWRTEKLSGQGRLGSINLWPGKCWRFIKP